MLDSKIRKSARYEITKKQVAIAIPFYKADLGDNELISFTQCLRILKNYQIVIFAPKSLDLSCLSRWNRKFIIKRFKDRFFRSIAGYNKLMLSEYFYESFLEYEYILIHQLDAFVFHDSLLDFCKLNFDYIGAPWPKGLLCRPINVKGSRYINKVFPNFNKAHRIYVGNGGLSLRKVKSFIYLLKKYKIYAKIWGTSNEDAFFSLFGNIDEQFKVAPIDVAASFSIETYPKDVLRINRNLIPFGCHAWTKYDEKFMSQLIENYSSEFNPIDKERYL